jgi:transposase
LARLDALLEILGPAWHAALGSSLSHTTPLRLLAAGYADPHILRRLGHARLARFLHRHSRGAWNDQHAHTLLAAATETIRLWNDELDFADLADDIAVEARLALAITTEIAELDERITTLVARRDPAGIIASAPGVGPITHAMILGRLGDPTRFSSLAAVRAYSGLVPSLNASRSVWEMRDWVAIATRSATICSNSASCPVKRRRRRVPTCRTPSTLPPATNGTPSSDTMPFSRRIGLSTLL